MKELYFIDKLLVNNVPKFYQTINEPTGFINIAKMFLPYSQNELGGKVWVLVFFPYDQEDIEEYKKRRNKNKYIITRMMFR